MNSRHARSSSSPPSPKGPPQPWPTGHSANTPTLTWGLEKESGNSVFSDSPAGPYANDSDTALALPAQRAEGHYALLAYRNKTELEDGYDFDITEVSTDGGKTWNGVARFTGTGAGWRDAHIDLSPWLKEGSNDVRARLRIKSDFSETRDGWKVDDVRYLVPAK